MKLIPIAISQKFARQGLIVQKHSPNLLFGVGVAGMIGTTVLASRATLKLEGVLEESQRNLAVARTLNHEDYSEEDRKRDTALIYVQSVMAVGKLYAPAVVLGGVSIAALTSSHNILNRRNAALTAAYAAVEKGFSQYRDRVIEMYGEETDRNLRYGTEKVQIVDEVTGKKKTVVRVASDDIPSMYARFFDEYSSSWSKEPEYNLLFLRCQQNYANDLLRSRGHLFLNEVYDMLGIQRTQAGAIVGWVIGKDASDNFVDFGIFDGNENARDFVNGREGSVLLDFNVDGVIWDLIDDTKEAISWQKS